MHDDEMKMSKDEFLRASFFSSQPDFDAAKAATANILAEKAKQRAIKAEIRALAKFAKALETQDVRSRWANIGWLADRYLGIKIGDLPRRRPEGERR